MTKQEILSFLGKPVISTAKRDGMASGCVGIVVAVRTDDLDSEDYVFCVYVTKNTTAILHDFDTGKYGFENNIWETVKNPPRSFVENCFYLFLPNDLTILTN